MKIRRKRGKEKDEGSATKARVHTERFNLARVDSSESWMYSSRFGRCRPVVQLLKAEGGFLGFICTGDLRVGRLGEREGEEEGEKGWFK